jgi:hypothetical protein
MEHARGCLIDAFMILRSHRLGTFCRARGPSGKGEVEEDDLSSSGSCSERLPSRKTAKGQTKVQAKERAKVMAKFRAEKIVPAVAA